MSHNLFSAGAQSEREDLDVRFVESAQTIMKAFTTVVCPFTLCVITPQLHCDLFNPERPVIGDELFEFVDATVFNVDFPIDRILFEQHGEV